MKRRLDNTNNGAAPCVEDEEGIILLVSDIKREIYKVKDILQRSITPRVQTTNDIQEHLSEYTGFISTIDLKSITDEYTHKNYTLVEIISRIVQFDLRNINIQDAIASVTDHLIRLEQAYPDFAVMDSQSCSGSTITSPNQTHPSCHALMGQSPQHDHDDELS